MNQYIETWKAIAFELGRSERWCRYMAQDQSDPLPVFKVGGIVRILRTDLSDWLARRRDAAVATRRPPTLQLIA